MANVPALNPNILAKGLGSVGKGFNFHFSVSQIIAGFLFGTIGFYIGRSGYRNANFTILFIGMGLVAYPYFITNASAMWVIGIVLTALAWKMR